MYLINDLQMNVKKNKTNIYLVVYLFIFLYAPPIIFDFNIIFTVTDFLNNRFHHATDLQIGTTMPWSLHTANGSDHGGIKICPGGGDDHIGKR